MTPERHSRIGELFHAVLGLGADERAAFLERECAGDTELRREVEALVRSHEGDGGVIDRPALDVAAELLARGGGDEVVGRMLAGRYRVLSLLGEGGMGRVYLAEDPRLGRKVALKLLPPRLTADAEGGRRFEREARAASALSHPNIVTVYDVSEEDGASVIASEYIEGETLRERLARGPFAPPEAVEIAAQIASALRAAHEAGIVHRDVKPENVMLRTLDGGIEQVKLIDFGIAKLAPQPAAEGSGQNGSAVRTHPGLIMGTDRYMSPEQARGQEVDARTDVWSLGCVIYEMLAGAPPFTGETAGDVLAAVLKAEPTPLPRVAAGTPGELQRIVGKCLEKGREARYQSAEELLDDLRRLQKRLEAGGWPGPSAGRGFAARAAVLVALILCAGSLGLYFYKARSAPPVGDNKSIAVLPLKPISAASQDEIYEVGIADSLINRLSSTKGLVVRPLSATRKYTDAGQDPLAAGREQQTDYVLASNYQLAGGKIRITAQLLEVAGGQVAESYKTEKDAGDVFAMQDVVADEIGKLLLARFSTAASRPALRRGTKNEEAYRLYLQGMYLADIHTLSAAQKAVELLERAVELDPEYAQAWAGKAYAHRAVANFMGGSVGTHEDTQKSMEAIKRALSLDENLAEAYSTLCENKMYYDYDFAEAESACRRAIELNPNSPLAHQVYSRYLISRGRFDEAITEIKTTIDLEPASLFNNSLYGINLYYARRYPEAVAQFKRVIAMDENFAHPYYWLYVTLAAQGNESEAFEIFKKWLTSDKEDEATVRAFQAAYQASGWRGVMREHAKRFGQDEDRYFFGAIYNAQAGNKDKAFEYLEKSYQRREMWMSYLQVDPRLDPLRDDPRFGELVKRLRLQ